MKRSSQFPQQIWVTQEKDGDESYLLVHKNPIHAAEKDKAVVVGVYEFQDVQRLSLRVVSEK